MTVVLAGTLFLFQNSAVNSQLKLAFVALCLILGAWSFWSLRDRWSSTDPFNREVIKPVMVAAIILAIVPVLSLLQLGFGSASLDSWLRDAVGYLSLPALLLVGVEAGLRLSWRTVTVLVSATSLMAAALALSTWLSRRGGDVLGFSQLGLASSMPVFAGIALALTLYFNSRATGLGWLMLGLLQIAILVSTGGRQPAIFAVVGLLLAAVFSRRGLIQRVGRLLVAGAAAVLMYGIVLAFSETFGGGIAARRLDFFDRVLDSGWSAVQQDGSVIDRSNAYEWTLQIWLSNFWFGRGLGINFPSVRSGYTDDGGFTLDTPLVVLAKFGLVGAVAVIWAVCLVFAAALRARKHSAIPELRVPTYTVVAVGLVVCTVLNGFPTENRGFGIFLTCLVVVVLAASRKSDPTLPDSKSHGLPARTGSAVWISGAQVQGRPLR
ncbi:O-antigen ligase family protein [Microbacterium sp. MM2322]|uniref:O-antigen ligase family protein n=1 Tax=Microbacterium sp. MM2322 TaxID=3157631 RepID=UPI0032D59AE0